MWYFFGLTLGSQRQFTMGFSLKGGDFENKAQRFFCEIFCPKLPTFLLWICKLFRLMRCWAILLLLKQQLINEPPHDKTNKIACAPSEESDQPGHPPSLIRVFAVRMKKTWVYGYPLSTQRRLIRLGICHFVGFVIRPLNCLCWGHMPFCRFCNGLTHIWTASSEFDTFSLGEQRRFRRACASVQSRQNLRCSLI